MFRVGTAGWSIPRAVAERFPGEGTHLARYARVMPCAEIDTSFYRSHARATYEKWASYAPRGFRFAVKLPRSLTHEGRLKADRAVLEKFLDEVRGLGQKLGPLLVQLPPSLKFDSRSARRFFQLLRELHAGALVCEPRHATWFEAKADTLLQEFHVGRAAADPALAPAAATPGGWLGASGRGTGTTVYFRLHGTPRVYWSPYTEEQLREWSAHLRPFPKGADVWCIFDNTAAGAALENALRFTELLKT
ncbi:MAG: hypothetical protein JWN73_1205 [Betaproteobacteria bacterium]|nr:hypothetical protein [Betaproteobacteria bacterium]